MKKYFIGVLLFNLMIFSGIAYGIYWGITKVDEVGMDNIVKDLREAD